MSAMGSEPPSANRWPRALESLRGQFQHRAARQNLHLGEERSHLGSPVRGCGGCGRCDLDACRRTVLGRAEPYEAEADDEGRRQRSQKDVEAASIRLTGRGRRVVVSHPRPALFVQFARKTKGHARLWGLALMKVNREPRPMTEQMALRRVHTGRTPAAVCAMTHRPGPHARRDSPTALATVNRRSNFIHQQEHAMTHKARFPSRVRVLIASMLLVGFGVGSAFGADVR